MCIRTADVKSQCIALVFSRYLEAGLDPYEYIRLELGNEPANGGSGAPDAASGYWGSTPIGYWDSFGLNPSPGGSWVYSTFLEYFNIEYFLIEYLGLPLISPTFTAKSDGLAANGLTEEVWTFIQSDTDWYDDFISNPRNCWGVNFYYSSNVALLGLGAAHYANWAVDGRDNRRALTNDVNSFWSHINQINSATATSGRIVLCENGVNPEMAGMVEDLALRQRQKTFFELGRMRIAVLDKLRRTEIQLASHFAASDSDNSAVEANQFGAFNDQLGTTSDQTYSSEIAFALRAGLDPTTPYAGPDYILADTEVLPPFA